MRNLTFKADHVPGWGGPAYFAKRGKWGFLILNDGPRWTTSYRLLEQAIPKGISVSASSTLAGPFESYEAAVDHLEAKYLELRSLN